MVARIMVPIDPRELKQLRDDNSKMKEAIDSFIQEVAQIEKIRNQANGLIGAARDVTGILDVIIAEHGTLDNAPAISICEIQTGIRILADKIDEIMGRSQEVKQ